jgi:hypothetical protein
LLINFSAYNRLRTQKSNAAKATTVRAQPTAAGNHLHD